TRPVASISMRPFSGSVETAAIFFPVMATVRIASRPDAGSTTRPPRRTTSYDGAASCAASSAEPSHAPARIAVTLLLLLCLNSVGGGFFFPARAAQNVAQAVVAFVTRVFVHRPVASGHRERNRPRPRPGRRILDGEPVLERVGVDAGEALDQMQIR